MAGVSRQQYASEMKLIRLMCSGRIDLEFILRAFANGQDGVFIGGCRLDECNYVTHGNYDALSITYICKKIMKHLGINPERLTIEFMSGGDGNILADVINKFTAKIKDMGPLGEAEGIAPKDLKRRLSAARKLVPYIRLVERERLRVPVQSGKAYEEFFSSDDTDTLFNDLIVTKLAIAQITMLLSEKPLSTSEISEILQMDPSEVAKHLNNSSRQGLVRYDVVDKCYALA